MRHPRVCSFFALQVTDQVTGESREARRLLARSADFCSKGIAEGRGIPVQVAVEDEAVRMTMTTEAGGVYALCRQTADGQFSEVPLPQPLVVDGPIGAHPVRPPLHGERTDITVYGVGMAAGQRYAHPRPCAAAGGVVPGGRRAVGDEGASRWGSACRSPLLPHGLPPPPSFYYVPHASQP